MPFVPLVAMGALVFCLVNLFKHLTNGEFKPVVTQIISWASGVLVVCLYAQTDWADKIMFDDKALSSMNGSSQFAIGLAAASIFGVGTEVIKAVDNTDSAAKPSLVPPGGP